MSATPSIRGMRRNGRQCQRHRWCFWLACSGSVLVFFVLLLRVGQGDQQRHQEGGWAERRSGTGTSRICRRRDEDGKRQDLASNPEMEQKELQQMTSSFP